MTGVCCDHMIVLVQIMDAMGESLYRKSNF